MQPWHRSRNEKAVLLLQGTNSNKGGERKNSPGTEKRIFIKPLQLPNFENPARSQKKKKKKSRRQFTLRSKQGQGDARDRRRTTKLLKKILEGGGSSQSSVIQRIICGTEGGDASLNFDPNNRGIKNDRRAI